MHPGLSSTLPFPIRAVTDSINQLITMCTQQAPGQKECDNALRQLEVSLCRGSWGGGAGAEEPGLREGQSNVMSLSLHRRSESSWRTQCSPSTTCPTSVAWTVSWRTLRLVGQGAPERQGGKVT